MVLLKSTSQLKTEETEIEIETGDIEKIEENILGSFVKDNPSKFNSFLPSLMNSFSLEKQEDEKKIIFENRLLSEIKKILNLK